MNGYRILAPMLLSAVLSNCASSPDAPASNEAGLDINTLQELLPGTYSNFAQIINKGTDGPVTDIRIRQLMTLGEPVFLFASELRGLESSSHDVYWLKLNRQTQQAEFHFTHLMEDELSLPMQDILATAWQRVVPGCVLPVNRVGDRFNAQTNPDTCVFEDPLQGETRLIRSLSIGADMLTIKTELKGSGGKKSGDDTLLELQKHRVFLGWASTRIEAGQQQDKPGEWQLSQVFTTHDDGRVNHLYDQDMVVMAFGLQLARLHRFDAEAPYLQLSVINLENGQTQAYQWFEPGSERLNLNLDWFQTNLEAIDPANPPP
jgi:hypothetical protein